MGMLHDGPISGRRESPLSAVGRRAVVEGIACHTAHVATQCRLPEQAEHAILATMWGRGGMADAHDLGSCAARRVGSTPTVPRYEL